MPAFTSCYQTAGYEIKTTSSQETAAAYPEVDEYIKQQMAAEDIPGLAVVVIQAGEVVYLKGFGVTSLNDPSPVTPRTIFDLASVSKSFTALGVLLLRDEGLIDLDAPVQQYLPDFQPDDPRAAGITVRQLLNQTSGLPGSLSTPLIFQDGEDDMKAVVAAASRLKLNRNPGSSFEYADINYCLLGALIEQVSGTTFEEYMAKNVFVPLGMDNTTLYPDKAASLDRASGHQPMYGHVVTHDMPIYRSAAPAGWVMSCAEDMGTWLLAQLNCSSSAGEPAIPAVDFEECHTAASVYMENGEEVGYGMGWITSCQEDVSLIWHGGDTPTFTADMILLPEYQTGIAVLVNSQASTGHGIATGIINLIIGLNLKPMTVPWWAHWKAIDIIASFALIPIFLLLLGLVLFIWRIWRQFRAKERHFIDSPLAGSRMPAWQMTLYLTPAVLLILISITAYLVFSMIYGYNPFEILFMFYIAAPPGVYIAGMALLFTVLLLALLMAFIALFTRGNKTAS